MSYNILNKNVNFQGATQGTIEDIVDTHSTQTINGSKTITNLTGTHVRVSNDAVVMGNVSASLNISASAFYANGVLVNPSGGGISFDGSATNGLLTFKDSDEATVESNLTFDGSTLDFKTSTISGSGNISGSAFYGNGANLSNVNATTVSLASNSGLANSSGLIVDPTTATDKGGSIHDDDVILVADSNDGNALKKVTAIQVASLYNAAVTTYGGSTANQVIVANGVGNIQGRANLTFDNSTRNLTVAAPGSLGSVVVNGTISGSGTIQAGGDITGSSINVQTITLTNASNLAGAGLADNSGALDIQVSGAIKLASDKVGISGSIAGNGLSFAGGQDSVSSLAVNLQPNSGLAVDATGLKINMNSLATATPAPASDSVAFIDSDGDKKCSFNTFLTAIAGANIGVSGSQLTASIQTTDIDSLSPLGGTGLHQTEDHFMFSDNGTEKKISFSNLEDAIFANVSGDIAIAAGGNTTIQANAVEGSMLNSNVAGAGLDYGSNQLSVDVSDFLANGLDNRIVTAVNADSMNAEASFTFDGTTLTLTGSSIFSGSATTFDTTEFVIQSATSEKPTIELKNTTPSDTNAGVLMNFFKQPSDNVGESDNNTLGGIKFLGLDSGNNSTTYAQMTVHSSDKSGGDEGGEFRFYVMAGGTGGTATLNEIFSIGGEDVNSGGNEPCEVVVNDAGIDCNLRVESDTNTHAFFVDGTNGHIGFGTDASTGALLLISGSNDEYLFEVKQQNNGYPTAFLAGENHATYPGLLYNRGKLLNGGAISQGNLEGQSGSHTRLTVRKTSIADNTATSIVTITVPNANHAAAIRVFGLANFDNCNYAQSFSFEGSIARGSGSPTDKGFSSITTTENAGITPNFTIAAAGSANTGGNSATQTFDLQLTIDTSDGSSSNATIMIELINFNDSGITMAAS